MKKRFYRSRTPKKPEKKLPPMVPGADKGLKRIFQEIGVPEQTHFQPDPFQLEAIEAIKTADCLVTAPTGAGKTWIAEQVAKKVMETNGKTWYATPLKALTNSIHAQFSKLFGKENVGILTGDIKENADAAIVIGTTEILRNQLYDSMYTGKNLDCDLIILDEAHFLGDPERGVVWEEIMIYLPVRIPLLLLSATIGNPDQIAGWLASIRGKACRVVENHYRPVPLHPIFFHPSGTLFPLLKAPDNPNDKSELHHTVEKFVNDKHHPVMAPAGKLPQFSEILKVMDHFDLLPAIFFLKSRAECDQAVRLCNGDLLDKTPGKKQALIERLDELTRDNPHLQNHPQRKYLEQTGTAGHHSGHLPAWKVVVETLMAAGLLNAMFATSTVAAGVNFPARSVVVLNSDRFNGSDFMSLTPSEFQQMAGRAGRRGMDNIGFGLMLPGKFMNLKYVARLINAPPLDVDSQIKIDFSMVLNLLLSHTPDQIQTLLDKSFASYLIGAGQKGSKLARKRFGNDMEHLWLDFQDHMAFLNQENFVTGNGELTEDGLWASKLRIDSPLLVAESIRQKLLPLNDPALLAAIIGTFVNEKEFTDDPLHQSALPKRLKEKFLGLRYGLKPFAIKLLKKGFPAPNLYIQPAALLYGWAHDRAWEELMVGSAFAEGDFARLILRTAENLRQIAKLDDTFPQIAQTAKQAIELILKEPVVTLYN
ncbi:MAG: DEAD/DEAH box helicase [Proteobacteria bacterium]|nr:DEAD/DEAH box helicase [Pseudomonadota bacterium]